MKKNNLFKYKGYTHFDERKNPVKYLDKIKNPCWVKKHGFYPFIHYKIVFNKYIEKSNGKEKKKKKRNIYYSSHIDRYIYQYYADNLNKKYNRYAKVNGINQSIIGYRRGFKGKNNIHFAKEVFEFIAGQKRAIIIVGDFSDFFDNLDHEYLKQTINMVQGTRKLEDDEYKVFKSITKFTYVNLDDIEADIGKTRKEMRRDNKYYNTQQFQEFKKKNLHKNEYDYGIPQGSAISAVYSNVYMVEFDKYINSCITGKGGLYRRYCDDFIIVVPFDGEANREETREFIENKIEIARSIVKNLVLHPDKTQAFSYNANSTQQFEQIEGYENILDYLGFSFDGKTVKLREKSLFKYYSRAYKKVKIINSHIGQDDYNAIKKSMFRLYTHLGDKKYGNKRGNFITYARKTHEIMMTSSSLESGIYNQYKRHWNKLIKRID